MVSNVSHAPRAFSAPLISSEASNLVKKIHELTNRFFDWIRSFFSKLSNERPSADVALAARSVKKLEEEDRPHPLRFLFATAKGAVIPSLISWYSGKNFALSAFAANKAIEASSRSTAYVANFFFITSSRQRTQALMIAICAPTVYFAADYMGYPQGKLFFLGVVMNIYQTLKKPQAKL